MFHYLTITSGSGNQDLNAWALFRLLRKQIIAPEVDFLLTTSFLNLIKTVECIFLTCKIPIMNRAVINMGVQVALE
jgi:hypothetical protein